ncbi:hypothetical protein C8J56DRAFT_974927 [Mycena floridula]|nr:hypothetical protein C8J56DRAFT_974927 [Mycena floridula]
MSPKKSRNAPKSAPARKCTTLLEDDDLETRCSNIPTHGTPVERCSVHHKQYMDTTKKYKSAQRFVDETFSASSLPTKDDVAGSTDVHVLWEKARLLKRYIKAIREERTGRELHHKRFIVKVDDGHKIRIKVLARQMKNALEIQDLLENRVLELHLKDHPAKAWAELFAKAPMEPTDPQLNLDSDIAAFMKSTRITPQVKDEDKEDEDLIGLRLRMEKEKYLPGLRALLDPEPMFDSFFPSFTMGMPGASKDQQDRLRRSKSIWAKAIQQYMRRIIFQDSHLFSKSLDKVSFKDFIMDDDLSAKDAARMTFLFGQRMAFGLRWWKDSLIEAIAMEDKRTDDNPVHDLGNLSNRLKVLDGWIYNTVYSKAASDEAWWLLFTFDCPQKNTENRYVRVCSSFDELHTMLTFCGFGFMEDPSFCTNLVNPAEDCRATRKHLSLCQVFVTDMISPKLSIKFPNPIQTTKAAKKRGHVTWMQFEARAYMFGAIRNEPDTFTDAFLKELRARPDLFYVITRSETAPGRTVETIGNQCDQVRSREFETLPFPAGTAPPGQGEWVTQRSAMDVLYGRSDMVQGRSKEMPMMNGYLTSLEEGLNKGWFFRFKTFPVKYFVIFDTVHGRPVHHLARQVAWAAFRALGIVKGFYEESVYDRASDVLFNQHAKERLSFLPPEDWGVTGWMADSNAAASEDAVIVKTPVLKPTWFLDLIHKAARENVETENEDLD